MALTADPITAHEAQALGLVARVHEPGQALDVALALAERVARNAPLTRWRRAKRSSKPLTA